MRQPIQLTQLCALAVDHLLTVMRYVERNPVRANFTDLAEAWL